MAYRERTPDDAQRVHEGLFVPWRGLGTAALCALAAAFLLAVHGGRGFALWVPMGALAAFTLASTLQRARWVVVRVLARSRVVLVSERGARGTEERELEVGPEDALGVRVTRDESWLGQLPGPALVRGAIVLVTPTGESVLVSPLVGRGRQRAIAEQLRASLDLDAPVRESDALAPRGWPPARTATMFAMLVTLVTLAGSAFEAVNATRTGVLELECVERCRFDGIDCLPGGSLEGRYDPGDLVVEVSDPRAPAGMRAVRVPIALRHRTRFECRAAASSPTPMPE